MVLNFLFAGFYFPEIITRLGIILGGISFIFLAPGHYQLADNWRVGSGEEGKKELIVSGIFSITRNPIYLYFTVFSFLLFLMIGKLIYFFLFLLVALSPHGVILYEEKNLEKLLKKNIWSIKKVLGYL